MWRQSSGSRENWMISRICALPAGSCGWALPAMMICTGLFLAAQDPLQPLDVAEEQRGPFVCGEAAGEADGEGVRIEHFAGVPQFRRGCFAAQCGRGLAVADELDEAAFAPPAHLEQFLVGDLDGTCSQTSGSEERSRQSGARYWS